MAGRVVVIQASSSEDISMSSPTARGDGLAEIPTEESTQSAETKDDKIAYKYDREDMFKLYNHPLAKVRPSILSPEFDMAVESGEGANGGDASGNKLWNPELWIRNLWNPAEQRQGNSSGFTGPAGHNWTGRRQGDHDGVSVSKKKQVDRLKTENEDGIVLSPQRRSFGAGCQVASSSGNAVSGSQAGSSSMNSTAQNRRSASPLDDRNHQVTSQRSNSRASFRPRGGISNVGSQPPVHQSSGSGGGGGGSGYHHGHGRGDRIENWRDRTGVGSSNYGRGNAGKEVPASVTYSRSRSGNTNSWNTGTGRRSYGGGGYHQHHHGEHETLPEWVTDGPEDMFETMELHGFDEEERQQVRKDHNTRRGGPVPARQDEPKTTIQAERIDMEKRAKTLEEIERSGAVGAMKRDVGPVSLQQGPSKHLGDTEKVIGKMSAEALVDGFDIGDMAQFLSVAGADFDSIKAGELPAEQNAPSLTGSTLAPATPSAANASRFSRFFTRSATAIPDAASAAGAISDQQQQTKKPQQPQSVNIMELLSKAASGSVAPGGGGNVPHSITIPAEAKSLDEIEAAYKTSPSKQKTKPEVGNASNKVLQDLFRSATAADTVIRSDTKPDVQQEQKHQEVEAPVSGVTQRVPEPVPQPPQILPVVGGGGSAITKGNPLADPAQQQHFLEALRKLHLQQQMQQQDQRQRHGGNFGNADGTNTFMAGNPQLAFQQFLQHQQAMQMSNLQANVSTAGRGPSPLGIPPGVMPSTTHQNAAGITSGMAQGMNPAFPGFIQSANAPPPAAMQRELLLAQAVYQKALMERKMQQGLVDESVAAKAALPGVHSSTATLEKMQSAQAMKQQMPGMVKSGKDGEESASAAAARPIMEQQQQQQQQLLETLRKLQLQQQQMQSMPQQQPPTNDMGRRPNFGNTHESTNAMMAGHPQLGGLQQLLQHHHAMQMQAAMNNAAQMPNPLGVLASVVPNAHQHGVATSTYPAGIRPGYPPQFAGFQPFLQHQAMQNLQAAAANKTGQIPNSLGIMPGVVPGPHPHSAVSTAGNVAGQAMNPAFAGMMPPSNIPPPAITHQQQDLLLAAHTQAVYQRALMNRKAQQQNVDDSLAAAKATTVVQNAPNKLPAAFLPTAVIKQMHGAVKPNDDAGGSEESMGMSSGRPIVKQQVGVHSEK